MKKIIILFSILTLLLASYASAGSIILDNPDENIQNADIIYIVDQDTGNIKAYDIRAEITLEDDIAVLRKSVTTGEIRALTASGDSLILQDTAEGIILQDTAEGLQVGGVGGVGIRGEDLVTGIQTQQIRPRFRAAGLDDGSGPSLWWLWLIIGLTIGLFVGILLGRRR